MSDEIKLDVETMRAVAGKLVAAYDKLCETPDMTTEYGHRGDTSTPFRMRLKEVLDAHRENGETLILQLASLSQKLRAAGASFQDLEDDHTAKLLQLERQAYAIQESREAEARSTALRPTDVWRGARGKGPKGGTGSGSGDMDGSGL